MVLHNSNRTKNGQDIHSTNTFGFVWFAKAAAGKSITFEINPLLISHQGWIPSRLEKWRKPASDSVCFLFHSHPSPACVCVCVCYFLFKRRDAHIRHILLPWHMRRKTRDVSGSPCFLKPFKVTVALIASELAASLNPYMGNGIHFTGFWPDAAMYS